MSSARSGWRRWQVVGILVAVGLDLAVLPRCPVLVGSLDVVGLGIGIWRIRSIGRAYRATRAEGFGRWNSAGTALGELPGTVRILILMNIGGWWALGRLLARRSRPAPGHLTLSYGSSERIFCSIFAPLSVIEVVVIGYFVHHTPVWLDWDLAGVAGAWLFLAVGLQNNVFPHELSRDVLRIRHEALTCLDLPVTLIESVSYSALGFKEERIPPGSLVVSTKDGTNLRLRLRSPWHPVMPIDPAVSRAPVDDDAVSTVFLSADDPKRAADAIRRMLASHDVGARDEGASATLEHQ